MLLDAANDWAIARLTQVVILGLALSIVPNPGAAGAAPASGNPWSDMDYGPFLTATIEAPRPATNIAFKGIAIRLAPAWAGTENETVVFDTDLLRYSAAWTGGGVALKGVVFDGEHWAYPRTDGDLTYVTDRRPGWARNGSFADPRPFIYGPLPRDWAHWQGLSLHSNRVVLHYSVGSTPVLELPGLEHNGSVTAFSRTLNLGAHVSPLTVQLAFESGQPLELLSLEAAASVAAGSSAARALALLGRRPASVSPAQPLATAPPRAPPTDGLLAFWTFERAGDGTAPDRSGRHAIRLERATLAAGPRGPVLECGATTSAVADVAEEVGFEQVDLTFAARIRTREDGTVFALAPRDGPWVPDGKSLFLREGRLAFDVGWVGAIAGSTRLTDDRWHQVAVTWSRGDAKVVLFVDGRREAEGILRPRRPLARAVLKVGYTSTNFPAKPRFIGQIEEISIHTRVLADSELAALAGPAPASGVLVAAVVGAPEPARWIGTGDGHLRLELPAASSPSRFRLLLARVDPTNLLHFAALVRTAAPPADLAPLTRGGPARWAAPQVTRGRRGPDSGPYAIDTLTAPEANPWHSWMRFGGLDFFADPTRAAICTWSGDVWIVSGLDDAIDWLVWRRFATGLFQPLGLRIVRDRIYVLGRDQITRLHDLDGDGEADFYENFNNDTLTTEHFHEFAMDLETDAQGDFYYMKGARHARDALHPQHGTLMKVTADGSRSEIIAKGFRAPNGLEVSPEGAFYSSDQEGHWMPANRLNRILPGRFYGNTWSWFPEGKPTSYEPPICWIHPRVDRSPSTLATVRSQRWGPLENRLLSLSYGVGRVFLLLTESVDGQLQGGVTPLPLEFDTGIMRARFNPRDGQLYVGGLFGWAGNKTAPGGFYRVRHTGRPLNLPTQLHIATNGVVVRFSDPLDVGAASDPGNYSVEVWNYRWTENYGSPDLKRDGDKGRDRVPVLGAVLSADRRSVFLRLPWVVPVMQMHIELNVRTEDGAALRTFVHNTVHRVPNRSGEDLLGLSAALASTATAPAVVRLESETPGLVRACMPLPAGPSVGLAATEPTRLAALFVPAGSTPSPFLPPGPFAVTWRGFIKLDLSGRYAFHARGSGRAGLRINGAVVFESSDLSDVLSTNRLLDLAGGLNPVEIDYTSPGSGDAAFRLFWSGPGLNPEPVPPTAFVCDAADPALRQARIRQRGRDLFLSRLCIRCHPSTALRPDAIPELSATAVPLDGVARRLAVAAPAAGAGTGSSPAAWLVRWLKEPAAVVPDTRMPACLSTHPDQAEAQARDLAAFLATLTFGATNDPAQPLALPATRPAGLPAIAAPSDPDPAGAGERLYTALGCLACHILPGEELLPTDRGAAAASTGSAADSSAVATPMAPAAGGPIVADEPVRRPLAHIRAKWQPEALAEFLEAPTRFHRGSRMPNFQLLPAEARALAAFVLARAEPTAAAAAMPAGDPARGRELALQLGCANCHPMASLPQPGRAGTLETLAGKATFAGCLGAAAEDRKTAPDFGLSELDRQALVQLLAHELPSLERDTPPDFARRQLDDLRCTACHQRDDQRDRWFALEARAAARAPKAANPYDEDEAQDKTIHRARPPLTLVGEKLRPDWLDDLFAGRLTYKPRPKLEARMPVFPAVAGPLARGLVLEHGLPPHDPPPPPPNAELARTGQLLCQKGALGCVDCHAVGTQPALAGTDTVTINFAYIPRRLRHEYFERYVLDPQRFLPGTMMPKFVGDDGLTGITAHFNGQARPQFDALWNFMLTVPAP